LTKKENNNNSILTEEIKGATCGLGKDALDFIFRLEGWGKMAKKE